MELLIIIFGALIVVAGIGMLYKPDFIFDYLKPESDNYKLHIFAIVFRFVVGMLLIYFAESSRYPVAMEVLGWFTVLAAIALILIGQKNFRRLIDWAVNFLKPLHLIGSFLAIAFGLFLIFAFL
jgi:uncharacterized membrane protein YidH (DUF202 family)